MFQKVTFSGIESSAYIKYLERARQNKSVHFRPGIREWLYVPDRDQVRDWCVPCPASTALVGQGNSQCRHGGHKASVDTICNIT